MVVNQIWLPGETLRTPSRRRMLGFGAAALSMMVAPHAGRAATTLPGKFVKTVGQGNDISESYNGARVVIGAGTEQAGGWPILRAKVVGKTSAFVPVGGQGVRISTDRTGNIWVVTASGGIFFGTFNATAFTYTYQLIPAPTGDSGARDVGVGWDGKTGSVWLVGADSNGAGNGRIYKFNGNLSSPGWTLFSGSANRVSADLGGNPWVTTFNSEIWQLDVASNTWTQVVGTGSDIGVGLTTSTKQFVVWVVAGAQSGAVGPVWQNTTGSATAPNWELAGNAAVNVAGMRDSGGLITNSANLLYHWFPA